MSTSATRPCSGWGWCRCKQRKGDTRAFCVEHCIKFRIPGESRDPLVTHLIRRSMDPGLRRECASNGLCCILTWVSDDLVAQFLFAAPEPVEIVAQDLDHIVFVAPRLAGRVGRDQHMLHAP